MNKIFVNRKTLSFIKSFNDTLKQTALRWKKYNEDVIKVIGRFDKNVNVIRLKPFHFNPLFER